MPTIFFFDDVVFSHAYIYGRRFFAALRYFLLRFRRYADTLPCHYDIRRFMPAITLIRLLDASGFSPPRLSAFAMLLAISICHC